MSDRLVSPQPYWGPKSIPNDILGQGFPRDVMEEDEVPSSWLTAQDSTGPNEPEALPADAPDYAHAARLGDMRCAVVEVLATINRPARIEEVMSALAPFARVAGDQCFHLRSEALTCSIAIPLDFRLLKGLRTAIDRGEVTVDLIGGKVMFALAE